jgi:hypothetical protein
LCGKPTLVKNFSNVEKNGKLFTWHTYANSPVLLKPQATVFFALQLTLLQQRDMLSGCNHVPLAPKRPSVKTGILGSLAPYIHAFIALSL